MKKSFMVTHRHNDDWDVYSNGDRIFKIRKGVYFSIIGETSFENYTWNNLVSLESCISIITSLLIK